LGILVSSLVSLAYSNPAYSEPSTELVHAGVGNATSVVTEFVPKNIEIKSGDSIMWDSPTTVPEPHSDFCKGK
jgi:hypothetical protein